MIQDLQLIVVLNQRSKTGLQEYSPELIFSPSLSHSKVRIALSVVGMSAVQVICIDVPIFSTICVVSYVRAEMIQDLNRSRITRGCDLTLQLKLGTHYHLKRAINSR